MRAQRSHTTFTQCKYYGSVKHNDPAGLFVIIFDVRMNDAINVCAVYEIMYIFGKQIIHSEGLLNTSIF